jgi:serine/threonine protein phosphatase PrpC
MELLGRLDRELEGVGETTAVVAVATRDQVFGASVGDSEAWMVGSGVVVLTQGQQRKPLLGSEAAVPVGFGPTVRKGRLVIGTDGLFKYVSSERIRELASSGNPHGMAEALVDAARLPSRALQDDVAVVVVT